MSLFPSPFLAKLQDLKLWQGNYEALLQNKSSEINSPSDFDTIEGISALDSTKASTHNIETQMYSPQNLVWDKKVVTPSKPFEQLLEEKLAEDRPVVTPVKPKKPFLKKGSGLVRFRMTYPQNKITTLNSKISKEKLSNINKTSRVSSRNSPRHENCFKNNSAKTITSPANFKSELRMPDINIKPKGIWVKVQQNDEIEKEDNTVDIMEEINEFSVMNFQHSNHRENDSSEKQ